MSQQMYPVIIAGATITGLTPYSVLDEHRGARPMMRIITAVRFRLTEGTPNTIASQQLTVVHDTPNAANEIQLYSNYQINTNDSYTNIDVLVLFCVLGKSERL